MTGARRGFLFHDRRDAGRILAGRLQGMGIEDPVIVGLPRGGVPVAYEVARALGAPLDIGLVRKLGAPGQPELGIGALGEDGTVIVDRDAVAELAVTPEQMEALVRRESAELERRRLYRGDLPATDVSGRTVILVDDGLATGVTATAAARVLHERGAARVVVAVPVCPAGAFQRLRDQFDEIVCLESPVHFGGVGAWYEDFSQTSDREVIALLRANAAASRPKHGGVDGGRAEPPAPDPNGETAIHTSDGATLEAAFRSPSDPKGVVVFVHGSGSSRRSPRNVAVARYLEQRGFATLLFDLLTTAEARARKNVFDIDLLTRRLVDATGWMRRQPGLARLALGYFGASTGAAAALRAAAALGEVVGAVVSRGGRPDLAGHALTQVVAPTLLIVGDDWNVLELNDEAATLLAGPHELAVVPRAGHLFEEPGALEQVARLAADWFERALSEGSLPTANHHPDQPLGQITARPSSVPSRSRA